jgi:hypothetical protein
VVDLGQLDEDVRARRQLRDQAPVEGQVLRRRIECGQVVEDDAELRRRVGELQVRAHQGDAGIGRVEHDVQVGQEAHAFDRARIEDDPVVLRAVVAAVADAAIERVLGVPLDVFGELRLGRIQPPHDADDDRVRLGDRQVPEIVFDPGARFDDDRADDPRRRRERPVAGGEGDLGLGGVGPRAYVGRALGACPVEEVDVRVDDRDVVEVAASARALCERPR